jgi:uncharacterized membrane protein SpoIIM required for sporulation
MNSPLADPGAAPCDLPVTLRSREFRQARESSWRELDQLLARAAAGPEALSQDELMRLPHLYRAALSSLSIARSIILDKALQAYLENLCRRAFLIVYAGGPTERTALAALLGGRAALAALWRYVAAALAILGAGAVNGYQIARHLPRLTPALLSLDGLSADAGPAANLFGYSLPMALLAAGAGWLAGVPTFVLLTAHGIVFGVLAHSAIQHAFAPGLAFWCQSACLAAALCLCGGAGLLLARAMLFPGPIERQAALADAARTAAAPIVSASAILAGGALLAVLLS